MLYPHIFPEDFRAFSNKCVLLSEYTIKGGCICSRSASNTQNCLLLSACPSGLGPGVFGEIIDDMEDGFVSLMGRIQWSKSLAIPLLFNAHCADPFDPVGLLWLWRPGFGEARKTVPSEVQPLLTSLPRTVQIVYVPLGSGVIPDCHRSTGEPVSLE